MNSSYYSFLILCLCFSFTMIDRSFANIHLMDNLTPIEKEVLDHQPIMCKKPKSKLFAKKSNLKMTLFTNMDEYLGDGDKILSIIKLVDDGVAFIEPVILEKRGQSRGRYCEYKPIRFKFIDNRVTQNIENKIGKFNGGDINSYIDKFFAELRILLPVLDKNAVNVKPHQKIFRKLGDDVKFVTHCGKSDWSPIGNGSMDDTPEARALAFKRHTSEALWYDILSLTKMPSMRIRKVSIDYVDIESKKRELSHFGFYRENPSSIGKRCGLYNKKPADADGFVFVETRSHLMSVKLTHNIMTTTDFYVREGGQIDGHNVKHLFQIDYGNKETSSVYVPYDFDLSALIVPDYRGDWSFTVSRTRELVREWNNSSQIESYLFLRVWNNKVDKIKQKIENSTAPEGAKVKFREWYQKVVMDILVKSFKNDFSEDFKIKVEKAKNSLDEKLNNNN